MKRPQPKQFKPSIRHSTPGSEFHSLLKDSFSNRNVYSTKMSTIPWPQPPTTTSILQPLTIRPTLKPPPKLPRISSFAYLKSNDQIRQKQLSLSNSTTSCTSYHISLYSEEKFPNRLSTKQNNTNKHPPPPPVPSNRVKSASGSSNASLSLISSSSSSPTLGSSMRTSKLHSQRQIKHKHDKNRLLHGDDHDVVMNRKESKSSDRLLYTGHTMKNNSIALPTTDIHNNNNYDYNPYVTDV